MNGSALLQNRRVFRLPNFQDEPTTGFGGAGASMVTKSGSGSCAL
jgi:hypothetical protein